MITTEQKKRFEEILEIKNIDFDIVEKVAISDQNILRPIKGISFEIYFKNIISQNFPQTIIIDGVGDSDVDLQVNGFNLQLKTPDSGSTKLNIHVGVALHKTHGDETRPNNLYKKTNKTFDFLILFHPVRGIFIIPYEEIPEHGTWSGYLKDPAIFGWDSKWLNKWELLGFKGYNDFVLDHRIIPTKSQLPNLSKETFLNDYEIIEMLCLPQYFRAAVMGLKGNIKEFWFKENLREKGLKIIDPQKTYCPYDLIISNKFNETFRVQVKGTSKNMCSLEKCSIGVEIMGTHGQFPLRGYKKSTIDYVAIIISEDQIPNNIQIMSGIQFVIINVKDLPLHYLIGKGIEGVKKGYKNEKWNDLNFSDVLYPNIKFKFHFENQKIYLHPDINSYKKFKNEDTIPKDSSFRNAGPYLLNEIPKEFF